MVEIKAEKNKRNRKAYIVKELNDVNIIVGIDLVIEMQHKYSGQMCKYVQNKRECVESKEEKRELLEVLEDDIKKNNPDGFDNEDFLNEFVKALKRKLERELESMLANISEKVDACFRDNASVMLQLEDTKIKLNSYCSFQVKYSGVNVEIVKNQEGK